MAFEEACWREEEEWEIYGGMPLRCEGSRVVYAYSGRPALFAPPPPQRVSKSKFRIRKSRDGEILPTGVYEQINKDGSASYNASVSFCEKSYAVGTYRTVEEAESHVNPVRRIMQRLKQDGFLKVR